MAGPSKTILIVDDEQFILTATAQLLRSAGHEVHTCADWAGVAATVRQSSPHLILMDYNMPSIKGDDLVNILKRNMATGDARVIIFSSESETDLARIVQGCAADGYIKKNVAGHLLLHRIEEALQAIPA